MSSRALPLLAYNSLTCYKGTRLRLRPRRGGGGGKEGEQMSFCSGTTKRVGGCNAEERPQPTIRLSQFSLYEVGGKKSQPEQRGYPVTTRDM